MATSKTSRAARWTAAMQEVESRRSALQSAAESLADAVQSLIEIQTEFQEWRDNLPENLQSSALGEKLDAVCDLDLESIADADSIVADLSTLDEANDLELPRGFGRD